MAAEGGQDGARQCLTTRKRLRKRQAYCRGALCGPRWKHRELQVTLRLHGGRDRERSERLLDPSLL